MKLYCIIDNLDKPHNEDSFKLLRTACEQRGVSFVPLEARTFDYAQNMQQAIDRPSLLYRMGIDRASTTLEALLVSEGVTTFHKTADSVLARGLAWGSAIRMQRAGLPIIPTVFGVDASSKDRLKQYAQTLGGFPVILKGSGGTHGHTVLRLDSLESLRSVLGYVGGDPQTQFVLRAYIPDAVHLRCVVLGDRVVDAIRYLPQPDDFRTNAVDTPQVEAYGDDSEQAAEVRDLAVRAIAVHEQTFGGVDVLIHPSGKAYIAEVNFPCNFARNQMNTGVDIAGQLVDYLLRKAKDEQQTP